jgi:histidyl-tRNA synthetase
VLSLFEAPTLDAARAQFGDRPQVATRADRLADYVSAMGAMGLGDFVEVDLSIVRGLAYYTGIVFELFDRKGELRAICGGGRYDNLLERVGGEALPAVGFGMGDVVLSELLRDRGLKPSTAPTVDFFIVTVSAAERPAALALAHRLRAIGRSVAYALREQPLKKQFSAAATAGARAVVVLGPEEAARGVAKLRDMESGTEQEVPLGAPERWGSRDGG